MKQKIILFTIIALQIISCIWYLTPSGKSSHTHVPNEFIEMIILGVIALSLFIITSIFYFVYKPSKLPWEIPFIIFFLMILLGLFYNQ